jgi:hypothetical protein
MALKSDCWLRAKLLLGGTLVVAASLCGPLASAQTSSPDIDRLEKQVHEMQREIDTLKAAQQSAPASQSSPVSVTSAPASGKYEGIQAGPLNLKFDGFLELSGIYRNRNEVSDVGSNYNAIPYGNASSHYLNEFRESARQSRLSLLVSGPDNGHQHAEGYYEMDFLGAAQSANSKESNSYNPRIRNIYGAYYNDDSGFSLLAGQNWSLLTQEKKGMTPRNELIPMTIDAQYVPGFNWTRNAQVRAVEKFNDAISVGLSLESPQALFSGKAPTGVITTLTGGGQFNNANSYTFDAAPDVIAKVAFDPGWGHYEVFGLARWFKDRKAGSATAVGENHTESGASVGGSVLLPLVPKILEFQASALTGRGAGRYGSAQLPDATFDAGGDVKTLKETTVLAGLVGHPTSDLDLYAYVGREKVDANFDAVPAGGFVGYGIPSINLSGCSTEGGTCAPNTGKVSQATLGGWWKAYRGSIGNMQVGLQASFTTQQALPGLLGVQPDAKMTVGMASIRYFPYQN